MFNLQSHNLRLTAIVPKNENFHELYSYIQR